MNILCRRRFFQLLAKPRCVVDGHELVLEWGKIRFIPLVPFVEHHVVLKLARMGRPLGVAKMTVSVRPGEVRHYSYEPPLFFWPGRLDLVEG